MRTDERASPADVPTHAIELLPETVAARLAELRALYVPEQDVDARAWLVHERPLSHRPFALLVAERLRELRALDDLARHLHSHRNP